MSKMKPLDWTLLFTITVVIAAIILTSGCSQREAAVTAANTREAGKAIAAITDQPVVGTIANNIVADATQLEYSLNKGQPAVATVTAENWIADADSASRQSGTQRTKTEGENASNATQRSLFSGLVDFGSGLLGSVVPGGATIAALLAWWRKGKWQQAATTAIGLGRQMTVLAEAVSPKTVEEIKGQFAKLQQNNGTLKLIVPILDAIKAAEPVTATDKGI
jgi:hypothetical protein